MTQQMGRVVGAVLTLLAVVVAVVALVPAAPSAAQPLPPNRFFGRATLDGQAAAGATIAANVGGTACGTTTADGSGNYRLDVLSSGERPQCGTDGATVTFTVGGARASQTATWRQGEFTPLDLTATRATATPTATPTRTATPTATATAPATATATVTATPTRTATPTVTATVAPGTPTLPRTGTGGGDSGAGWLALALAGLAVAGAGSVLAARRMRS